MSARYSWSQAIKAIRDAQTSLALADVKHRDGSPFHDAIVAKTRLALADAVRSVKALRAGAVQRRRTQPSRNPKAA